MDIHSIITNISNFLLYPETMGWYFLVKYIFIIILILIIVFIVFVLIKSSWLKRILLWDLKEFLTYRAYMVTKHVKEWKDIKKRLETNQVSEAKLAVIEADSLLNHVLKDMGYEGKSLGEKLDKLTTDILINIDEVREAHKIYSDIIHDPTYILELTEAKKAILIYEKALLYLQAL